MTLSKQTILSGKGITVAAAIVLFVFAVFLATNFIVSKVSAAPNDVVINELMYHPESEDDNDEFLELYNTTASPIDLEGWCFSGITLCFTAGMSIGANDYVVVSPSSSQSNTTYGITPIAEYTGKLANSGERIRLRDSTSTIISEVTFSDSHPWPITPDGEGPSLELVSPVGDLDDPDNWRASMAEFDLDPEANYSPAEQNSVYNSPLPVISNVTDPNDIAANASVNITAEVNGSGISDVNLIYQLDFNGDEAPIAMLDDGNSNDGAAGDNVYGASIPGQAIGTLIRFKIEATNPDGDTTSPRYDNSQNYHGYYIADPGLESNAEVIDWFIEDDDFTDMQESSPATDFYSSVIVYGDDVYDGSRTRLKGEYSLTFPKKSYKMNLPRGYSISLDWDNNGSATPIDEFHLNSDHESQSIARQPWVYWIAKESGMKVPDLAVVRLQRNGLFEGLYIALDKYDEEWRETNQYDDGALYEDGVQIEAGTEDNSLYYDWSADMLIDNTNPIKRDNVLDQNNIPALFNYIAVQALADSHDHTLSRNTFIYRSNQTERWEALLWDVDIILWSRFKMFNARTTTDYIFSVDRAATSAILDQPDLGESYYRRLRTLVDKLYLNNQAIDKYMEINDLHSEDISLDLAKWPAGQGVYRVEVGEDEEIIRAMRDDFLAYLNVPWEGGLPPSQTDADRQQVTIAQVVSDANNANEYIRLDNAANTPVDISNWYIEGINYTIPAGSVIPSNSSIYLLRDDLGYRTSHDPVLVAGQYPTDLSAVADSKIVLKTDTNMQIDEYDF